jgi:hypothetical protein
MNKRIWIVGLSFIFAICVVLAHSIHSTYMRDDEEIAFRTTSRDLGYTIWYQAEQDVHAPLWFASFWLWQQFMGGSEFMGRLYSIFWSLMTVASVYQLGRQWFGASRYGLFAIIALGVSAYFFIYSLEIRPYALNMLAATSSMWAFRRWIVRQTNSTALIYGLSVALMLYLHYFLIFLVAAQILFVVLALRPLRRRNIQQFILTFAFAFVIWLPWSVIFVYQIRHLTAVETAFGNARGLAGIGSTTEPTNGETIWQLLNLLSNGQIVLVVAVLLIGVVLLWHKWEWKLALAWAFGVPLITLTANTFLAVYTPRYVAYLCVGLAIAIGAVMAHLPNTTRYIGIVAFGLISLWGLPSQLPQNRTPLRALFEAVALEAQPGDAMFYDHASPEDNVVTWQIAHYLPDFLQQNQIHEVSSISEARRVWYVTADWFNPDVQTTFKQIEKTHPLQQVIGDCTLNWCYLIQRMEAPPWEEPLVFGESMAFWGADVDQINQERIQTRLWWRVTTPPLINYSMSLRLIDNQNKMVAQTDGPVLNYGQATVESSAMIPGQIYVDFRQIDLSAELAPGQYQLALVVYDWQTGVSLKLTDGSESLELDAVAIP